MKSKRLLNSVAYLQVTDKNMNDYRLGTGFFFSYETDFGKIPVLVSNYHVIADYDNILVQLSDQRSFTIRSLNHRVYIIQPGRPDISIVVLNDSNETGKEIMEFIISHCISENNLVNQADLESLDIMADIVAVSYPGRKILDTGAVPIIRKGGIASENNMTADGDMILLDIATYPSYSGSPVFLADSVRDGSLKLLSIEKASPQLNENRQYLHLSISLAAYQLMCLKSFAIESFVNKR